MLLVISTSCVNDETFILLHKLSFYCTRCEQRHNLDQWTCMPLVFIIGLVSYFLNKITRGLLNSASYSQY